MQEHFLTHSKLLEDANAFLDGRMRSEEATQFPEETHRLLAGVLDEELRHVVARNGLDIRVARDFPEGAGQGARVVRHLGGAGVGHKLALAGDGEAHEGGKEIADDSDHEGDEHRDGDASAFVVLVAPPLAGSVNQPPERQLGQHREDADEDDGDDEEADVAVADVGQLVRDNALKLFVVQFVDNALGEGYGIGAVVDAAGEGVEGIVVDDVDAGHFHALRDAEVLHEVIDTLVILAVQRFSPGSRLNHLDVGEISDDEPEGHAAEGVRCPMDEVIIRVGEQLRRRIAPPREAEPDVEVAKQIHQAHDEAREEAEEQDGAEVVAALLREDADVFHQNLISGACSSD